MHISMSVKRDKISITVENTCLKQKTDFLLVIRIERGKTVPKYRLFLVLCLGFEIMSLKIMGCVLKNTSL